MTATELDTNIRCKALRSHPFTQGSWIRPYWSYAWAFHCFVKSQMSERFLFSSSDFNRTTFPSFVVSSIPSTLFFVTLVWVSYTWHFERFVQLKSKTTCARRDAISRRTLIVGLNVIVLKAYVCHVEYGFSGWMRRRCNKTRILAPMGPSHKRSGMYLSKYSWG